MYRNERKYLSDTTGFYYTKKIYICIIQKSILIRHNLYVLCKEKCLIHDQWTILMFHPWSPTSRRFGACSFDSSAYRKQLNEADQSILHCCLHPLEQPHPVDSMHTVNRYQAPKIVTRVKETILHAMSLKHSPEQSWQLVLQLRYNTLNRYSLIAN